MIGNVFPHRALTAAMAVFATATSLAYADFITMVPVGKPGNWGDVQGSRTYGAVSYEFLIGKYEVTAGQYTEFLNAVAGSTDDHGLYNPLMGSSPFGCNIQRSGSAGSYDYGVAPGWANRPVNYVSFYDAARFANWLTTNNTETGVYGFSPTGDLVSIMDHQAALNTYGTAYFIPTEDEWYKAAYHNENPKPGDPDYWDYPTGSDSVPGNDLINPDPGNNANFSDAIPPLGYTAGSPYYRTEVGEFENSESPYGTFDQGGNVWEWNETPVQDLQGNWGRGLRGGSWDDYDYTDDLRASSRGSRDLTTEYMDIGFRLGAVVPEPGSVALWLTGAVALLVWRRRRA